MHLTNEESLGRRENGQSRRECVCVYLGLLSASVCAPVQKITIAVCVLICAKWICMSSVCTLLRAIVRDSYRGSVCRSLSPPMRIYLCVCLRVSHLQTDR